MASSWRYLFIDSSIYLLIHLFIYSFIHLFIYSFIHLFIYSFIHLFIYSFIHLFIYSFIHLLFADHHKEPIFNSAITTLRHLERFLPPPLFFSFPLLLTPRFISSQKTAPRKLQCLVGTASAILGCVTDYWEAAGNHSPVSVGGDELLPLLIFVMMKGFFFFLPPPSFLFPLFLPLVLFLSLIFFLFV